MKKLWVFCFDQDELNMNELVSLIIEISFTMGILIQAYRNTVRKLDDKWNQLIEKQYTSS